MSNLKHVTLDGVRIHLKKDENKLWINGQYVLYLNSTSAFIVESLIDSSRDFPKEKVPDDVIRKLLKKYKITEQKAKDDFDTIVGIINSFARNEMPLHLVGMTVIDTENFNAPNRMDISLTYNCNNNCGHCYLPKDKSIKGVPLTTNHWKEVIDKLWNIGIPQIVFTGGEPLTYPNIVELISYSKEFTTGIITNGTKLTLDLATQLKQSDLDWIQITLESMNKSTHDEMQGREGAFDETIQGIKNAVSAGLLVSINATLTKKNYKDIGGLIKLANNLGVKYVSTNAIINSGKGIDAKKIDGITEKQIKNALLLGKQSALETDIHFDWFLPTCYKNLNPIELGFGRRCCSACTINMMIEPTGDTIPCQSWTQEKLGNIMIDEWITIWNSPVAVKIRQKGFIPDKCKGCEYISTCGGSCPLEAINSE